jgi:hypothetical protein
LKVIKLPVVSWNLEPRCGLSSLNSRSDGYWESQTMIAFIPKNRLTENSVPLPA